MNHLQESCQRASHLNANWVKKCRKLIARLYQASEFCICSFQSIFGLFRLLQRALTIRCNAMLETVELPTGVADLDSGLPDMDGETLPHLGLGDSYYWGARLVQGAPRTRD